MREQRPRGGDIYMYNACGDEHTTHTVRCVTTPAISRSHIASQLRALSCRITAHGSVQGTGWRYCTSGPTGATSLARSSSATIMLRTSPSPTPLGRGNMND